MRRNVLFFILWFLVCNPKAAHSQTGAAAADAVSRENRARAESITGNAIDTGTGAFTLAEDTLSVQGARTLDFSLNYNSLLTANAGRLGFGWSHEFEAFISGDPQGTVTVHWDVNRKNVFQFSGTGAAYTALDRSSRYDSLIRSSTGIWTLTRLDGTVYTFDNSGLLLRIGNKVGQTIELRRANGVISEVYERVANRRVFLRYAHDEDGLLESIIDEENRIVHFGYDTSRRLSTLSPPVTLDTTEQGVFFAPLLIPDNTPAGVTHTINVTRSKPIGLVELYIANISHARPSDVTVTMISPQGTTIRIFNPVPSPTSISPNPWDLSGTVLDFFDGENPQGQWRFTVVDSAAGGTGTLNGWILRFSDRTDPTHYSYDSNGRITRATGPDGERLFSNSYDAQGRIVGQDDGVDTNMLATIAYETATNGGTRTTYRDRNGKQHLFEHNASYELLSYSDPRGNSTTYNYDGNGNRIRITDALNRVTTFGYDQNGNLTTVVDPAALIWTMEYDSRRNVTAIRDPLGRTSRFQYDSNNNLTRVTDAAGNSDTKTYNSNSQLAGNLMSDGAGINYGYANGMPATASHPAGNGSAGTAYDKIGRLTRLTDPDNNATTFVYDAQSRVVSKTDALGHSETKSYDRRQRVSQQTDRRGNRITYKYDNNDNLIEVTDALGFTTRFEYDGEDRQVRTIDLQGNAATVTFDDAGRKISETDADGVRINYEYDTVGNLTAVTDSSGTVIQRISYDARDLQVAVGDALGNKTTTVFNEVGKPVEIRDPLSRTTTWKYDVLDRLSEVRDPLGRTATQAYLNDDVISDINDARNAGVSFAYDGANRIVSIRHIGNASPRLYTYNGRDLVIRDTQTGGTRRNDFTYDATGRLTSVTRRPVSTTTPSTTVAYRYDDNGNTTEVSSGANGQTPSPRLTRTFDPLDRMTRFTDAKGNSIQYAYDGAGNLKTLSYPDGSTVTYTYDDANRMTSIVDWSGRKTRYFYDSNGRMIRTELPNGTARLMEYDLAGRMTRRREIANDGGVIAEYRFSYDAAGQLVAENFSTSVSTAPALSTNMSYDIGNRLATVDGQTAQYDSDDNLIQFKNRLYSYDLNNNLIAADNVTYAYDEEDRLISFSDATGTTDFVVNPGSSLSQVLVRRSANGAITRYVYGAGLVYEETNGQIRTYHYDLRGSTVGLADGQGVVAAQFAYGPYGELLPGSATPNTPFLHNGLFGVISGPTGLEYMRFRWYSPELKRFLNRDAHFGDISSIDSINGFSYAGDSPLLRVDPEGQFWWVAAGAIVGAVAAVTVRAASDLISGKFSGWKSYAAAAVGGAVTGAVIALCPTCGIIAGGLGSAAAYSAEKGFRGERVDPGELLLETALGGALGGVGGGAGKLTGKLAGKAAGRFAGGSLLGKFGIKGGLFGNFGKSAARRAVFGRADILKQTLKREIPLGFVRGAFQALGNQLAEVTGVAQAGDRFLLNAATHFGLVGSTEGAAGTHTAKDGIYSDSRLDVNSSRKSAYGEFIHWRFWIDSLQLAGRPLPNNPNHLLASF